MDKQTRILGPFLIALFLLLVTPADLYCDSATYTVERGDTLYSIARKFDVSLESLISANDITNPTRVAVGTILKIPAKKDSVSSVKSYIVKRGDTLYGLSRRFAIPLNDLLALNGLTLKSVLKVGQRLVIPASSESAAGGAERNPEELDSGTPSSHTPDKPTDSSADEAGSLHERGVPFWPHPGSIQRMKGKLSSAVVIIGRKGDSVVSVSTGRVTWAAPFRGFGKMVFVKSNSGFVYGYGGQNHLFVKVGDTVKVGTEIGSLGTNSHDGIAKVIFFVTKNGKPYEPSQAPRG